MSEVRKRKKRNMGKREIKRNKEGEEAFNKYTNFSNSKTSIISILINISTLLFV